MILSQFIFVPLLAAFLIVLIARKKKISLLLLPLLPVRGF